MRLIVKWALKRLASAAGGFYMSRIRSDMEDVLNHMRGQGFIPQSVIDVGVANGTKDLYEAFPNAQFVLVEPLREFEPYMQSLQKKYKVRYELAAAASTLGSSPKIAVNSLRSLTFFSLPEQRYYYPV